MLIDLIVTTNNLLTAQILVINADPSGLGNRVTHLMLANPIEKNVKVISHLEVHLSLPLLLEEVRPVLIFVGITVMNSNC